MEASALSRVQLLHLLQRQLVALYASRPALVPTGGMSQARLHHGVRRLLHGVAPLQRLGHDVHHGLVLQLVPDAVARHHHELVLLPDVKRRHLRRARDVRRVERRVALQQRDGLDELLLLQDEVPDAPRRLQHALHVHRLPVEVLHQVALLYASRPRATPTRVRRLQLLQLLRFADVVVLRQCHGRHALLALLPQHRAAVSCYASGAVERLTVGHHAVVAEDQRRHETCARGDDGGIGLPDGHHHYV